MNFGIINNRRPDPRKRGGASVNALLADPRMREIAQQMGLQPQDFGEEAQALWNTLNDLSASDPKRYESFINEQLQDGPPPPPADSSSAQATNDATPPRFFTPDPGFVLKCTMYHSIKSQQKETKLFLNICAHNLIDAPKNPNSGLEVPEDTRAVPNTSSLQVPLVVGKLREVTDFSGALCCAVDVVVNPWVLRRSEWDANFKREVMKLAVQWVQEDAKVRLITPTGKFIKARYKGGVTVGSEIITSKFRIEDADPTKQRMESPADLLKQIHLDEDKEDEEVQELAITPAKGIKATQKPAKKVLIEEKSGAVKRGFLNSTKSELYPEGSGEGRPSSAYVNLLSRSKILDLGEMEQQRKAQQDERKETLAFLEPTEKAKATQKRAASSAESQEVDCGDHFFEQLCEQAEPDLKPITRDGPHSQTMSGDQLFGEGFEEFAKLLTP
ncbi:uncharacterized protein PITG_01713 [Phytophthora infestans T30-4]|uniref:PIH1 N-terminal domain-containing protein n=1 Tax=Phytophthora infestans (strain T30-4) TaxID=403677 RepID=D0MTW9_PHYIT|nr:uncharacterized protein PITG_01713 [Phytophthora infestans T30-4]EEY61416.1 conserved hypothetical protein [Phytophthora infestans T30-4]|eukprot:XP_002908333.1 conserved hypothetical protein [Phytophthora infestans T30-4]